MNRPVAENPGWWPHRYDPVRDAVHFVPVPRDRHRAVAFLTDDYLPGVQQPTPVARAEAVAAAGVGAPLHFIFHSAYCCSTLLARAFDLPGRAMGFKEPVILNDLHGWKQRGARPDDVMPVLQDALTLLARPFEAGEAAIIKPSNLINSFAPLMLMLRPQARALLLYAPLRVYLGSIARKGMWGRLWVRDLMIKQLKDGMIQLGFQGEDYLGLTDLQVAAVGWLAQQALFGTLIKQFGPERVRSLDSERLMAGPAAALAPLAAFFGVPLDDADVQALVSGPVFSRHSKFGTDYAADDRTSERESGEAAHADEIEKILIWAKAVADKAGVVMALPAAIA